ncbi:helix-turn-helix domain-containing protein [Lactobacillus iners]|nr:helix-turn-helix domain-containing protein [Lactobacillus iners]MYM99976.1 hypothetical protein [Lactobacillus iners]PMC28548.1 hypothetical protein CJ224_06440 [Lactobacillus iners]PMC41226.1 hypothetical protein CJ223_06685 [Lactobacillus iners]PMC46132.1 hypothetical protein CJ222_06255 [Lactobacillus iners]PNH16698.1 hypothetical protein BWZ13_06095 [Lactobacillus iners]
MSKKQYAVIKELVDHHGNKKRAAIKLGIPIRQLYLYCIQDIH